LAISSGRGWNRRNDQEEEEEEQDENEYKERECSDPSISEFTISKPAGKDSPFLLFQTVSSHRNKFQQFTFLTDL
jgi:hypothetical protein